MKQSLKYGILLIFALLLHSIVTEATGETVMPDVLSHNKCFVSQARPMRNAIEKFYLFCSPLSCEMGHADLSYLPTKISCVWPFVSTDIEEYFLHFTNIRHSYTPTTPKTP